MSAPDISRLLTALDALAKEQEPHGDFPRELATAMRALRAALDAALADRDSHQRVAISCMQERDAADATGYARGVRDAAEVCEKRLISRSYGSHADAYEYAMNAILALLPAATTTQTKETEQ